MKQKFTTTTGGEAEKDTPGNPTNSHTIHEWEKEFDVKFTYSGIPTGIKSFIRTLLAHEKEQVREKCALIAEGKKKYYPYQNSKTELADMYDSACDDIAKEIRGIK